MPSFHIIRRLSVRPVTVDDGRKAPSESGVEGPPDRTSYRQLLRTPGLSALIVSISLARFGGGLWELTLILYTLQEWGSAELVGIVVLASWMPGILMSPIAGLLMDTRRRAPLVVLDFCVSATTAFAIVALASADLLEPWLLVAIVGVGSLTIPFGDTGRRTLLAVIPDHRHWDRTNALESASGSVTSTVAPAVAGLLVGIGAGELGSRRRRRITARGRADSTGHERTRSSCIAPHRLETWVHRAARRVASARSCGVSR